MDYNIEQAQSHLKHYDSLPDNIEKHTCNYCLSGFEHGEGVVTDNDKIHVKYKFCNQCYNDLNILDYFRLLNYNAKHKLTDSDILSIHENAKKI